MAKLSFGVLLVLILIMLAIPWTHSVEVGSWSTELEASKETVTNLQFFFHDTLSGKNPSAIRVAQAPHSDNSPTLFGMMMMADDPLTETPDPKSKLVGRAQGLYASAGQQELGLLMAMTFCFEDGVYNGSSISLFGRNLAMNPVREMPVVGGTGLFRFAQGYAIAKTQWYDPATGDAIVAYNVTVTH